MIGSVIFKLAMSLAPGTTSEKMCLWASAGGAFCFFALALGLSRRGVQIALLGFELCVGIYLNAMGMMRSKYIPQEVSFQGVRGEHRHFSIGNVGYARVGVSVMLAGGGG